MILSGCGTGPGTTSEQIAASPSAQPFASALTVTRTWAAADVEAVVVCTIDGRQRTMHGRGQVAIDKGFGVLEWTTDGEPSRTLVNDRAIFVQAGPPGGAWRRIEAGGRTSTSEFTTPLLHLSSLRDVTSVGVSGMDGFEAQRYRGTLPVTPANLEGLGLRDEEMQRISSAAGPQDAVQVTAWVDPHQRLVRIDRSLELGPDSSVRASILASMHLWNFGVMLDLASPPSGMVRP